MDRQQQDEHTELAELIERFADDIISRWIDRVRADAAAARVPLTDLQDGIHDYLGRLAQCLRRGDSLERSGTTAWADVAREHAITRVRLGFDIAQLFDELVLLRRVTLRHLREHAPVELGMEQAERISDLIDAAVRSSLASYIEYRDYMTRRTEAEHIGFLTHELKNPLAAITMAFEQLHHDDVAPERQKFWEIVDRNLERVRRMIDEVLLAQRLEVGEMECRPVDLTLDQLLGEMLDVFRRKASERRLTLTTDFDPALTLRADPALTSCATENLLENAIKYTDAGEVRFRVDNVPEKLVFHVTNPCSGFSPEELRSIFEPFKRHSAKPGTGLGLAIARRAIEAQGGTIHAEASNGQCHFWFTLPRSHH